MQTPALNRQLKLLGTCGAFARRAAWFILILGHAPLWFRATAALFDDGAQTHLVRAILLTATQAIFVLKLIDVPWLRIPATRRAWVAVAIGVALLHAGIIQRSADPLALEVGSVQTLLVAGGLAVGCGGRVVRYLSRIIDGVRARMRRIAARFAVSPVFAAALQPQLPPRFVQFARAGATNRAPPA